MYTEKKRIMEIGRWREGEREGRMAEWNSYEKRRGMEDGEGRTDGKIERKGS